MFESLNATDGLKMIQVQSPIRVPNILQLHGSHGSSTPTTFLPVKGVPMDAGGWWCGVPVKDVPKLQKKIPSMSV